MRLTAAERNLTRRYLLWAYKTTRESFERIERKTTQLRVDERILATLSRGLKLQRESRNYQKFIKEFEQYIAQKRQDELKLKFADPSKKTFHPQYLYLRNRLLAIEEAVRYFLGKQELKRIQDLFEKEFTDRILQAREH